MTERRAMPVRSIWFTPESDLVPVPVISVEVLGGLKDYLRVWLDADMIKLEWGWTIHHTAIRLWEAGDDDV